MLFKPRTHIPSSMEQVKRIAAVGMGAVCTLALGAVVYKKLKK